MGYFKSTSLEVPINVISVEPHSNFFDKVNIKIMYAGMNRNGSYFDKESIEFLAKSLPNTPLVGFFDSKKKDFKGHEQEIGFDENNKLKMISKATPYGVVPADSKVWWEWFDDNGTQREYLCCEGLIWTKRFPEIKGIIEAGTSNQSMELDEELFIGEWSIDPKTKKEFLYVKEAYLLGLCILGSDVEPCFEGANLSKPTNYSVKDVEFTSMLDELKAALNYEILKKSEGDIRMNEKKIDSTIDKKEEEVLITDADFKLNDEEKGTEECFETNKGDIIDILESIIENSIEGGGDDVEPEFAPEQEGEELQVEENSSEELSKEEEPLFVEEKEQPNTPIENNPLADENVPKPGLEPINRIEDAKSRGEEAPTETPIIEEKPKEEEKDFSKIESELESARVYIKQLEEEIAPLREMKSNSEMKEKQALLNEFKSTYGESVEEVFAKKMKEETVDQFKASLGMYAFENRFTVKKVDEREEPILTFTNKEDNRPSLVKALDLALGRN